MKGSLRIHWALIALILIAAFPALAAEKQRLRVEDYSIEATVSPAAHKLSARARVKFTALDDIATATFELHNALRLTRVTDADGHQLSAERVTQDSTVRVPLPNGLQKGAGTTLTFEYEGILRGADDSPVQGLSLAQIDNDISYLLYAGRWFPVAGYGTDRFTATIQVTVPDGYTVVASGAGTGSVPATPAVSEPPTPPALKRGPRPASRERVPAAPPAPAAPAAGKTYTYTWNKPGFPGTLIVGQFVPANFNEGGFTLQVYFTAKHKNQIQLYADTATKEFQFYTLQFGLPQSNVLKVVELPDDTVPTAWAPQIAAIASHTISDKVNYRLLANAIAHQWWGASVSPAGKDDWWLSDGSARYCEALYVQSIAGQAGFEEAVKDMKVGALAYDTVPLSRVDSLELFSPEFQALVTDKGAMILHMLRFVIGEPAFGKTMRDFATQYAGKPASVDDFQKIAEQDSGQKLTWFFTQWLDSTGAPAFKNKYTIYRIQNGFRVVGEISQDLDLFRMPVDLRIDTDGKTEEKRIDVVGTNSPYSIETFGKPGGFDRSRSACAGKFVGLEGAHRDYARPATGAAGGSRGSA